MLHAFRNALTATTAKSTGVILITALIGTGTAAADGISKVAVKNGGTVKLKVVILDVTKSELGRSNDYLLGSFPPIDLKRTVNEYMWEVFVPGAREPCDVGHSVKASSITVPNSGNHCVLAAAAPPPKQQNDGQQQGSSPQQSSAQQHASTGCSLSMRKEDCEIEKAKKEKEEAKKRLDAARTEYAKARAEYSACTKPPANMTLCRAAEQRMATLGAEILKDSKITGEPAGLPAHPGGEVPVPSTPVPTKPPPKPLSLFCPQGWQPAWDGTIWSCQKGNDSDRPDRPIPAPTDIDPKDPNRR